MKILVTNDDGVQAPGLLALVQALRSLGEVHVLAPDRNWSASGHRKTLTRPLRVWSVELADGTPAQACDGAPSDCVALALLGLVSDVDVVVSGINPYANVGQDLTYSGTVTAALEAVIAGVPGVAVSLDSTDGAHDAADYAAAAAIACDVVARVGEKGLPKGIMLNINVPYGPMENIRGVEVTRQGQRIYRDKLVAREDPFGRPYYWIGGERPDGIPASGTDIGALAAGKVSITPLHARLTADHVLDGLADWLNARAA